MQTNLIGRATERGAVNDHEDGYVVGCGNGKRPCRLGISKRNSIEKSMWLEPFSLNEVQYLSSTIQNSK